MSDRRGGEMYQQAALNRLADRVSEKVVQIADRLDERLDRIEQRQAMSDQNQQRLDADLNQFRMDIGELRDAARPGAKSALTEAARGFWATKLGKLVVVATGVTAIITAGEKVPKAMRAIDDVWTHIVEAERNDNG